MPAAYVKEVIERLKRRRRAEGKGKGVGEGEGEESKVQEEECPICLETAEDAVITPCAHVACRECLLMAWRQTGQGGPCPVCR